MGCATSLTPEQYPHSAQRKAPIIKPEAIITDSQSTNDEFIGKTYESILSSPGRLEIPPSHEKWFPSAHAHINCRHLFKYHHKIADGSTCCVHHIEYKSAQCALKQIPKDNEFARMLLETETQILSKLNHKGIIGFIDIFMDYDYYYLLLQKADYDLRFILDTKQKLSENKTRRIIYSILRTIHYMHRKNLVHRDIKPENIMFLASDTNNALLVDFGDAEIVRKDSIYVEFVGTAPYMSPERLGEHHGWQLKKSDIWAIAATAYEMYCGETCFVGSSQKQVFQRILSGDWQWPNTRIPSVAFQDFVTKCLAFDAKERLSAKDALNHRWFDCVNNVKEVSIECNVVMDEETDTSDSV